MQYLFQAKRAIPELGVTPGDLVALSPMYGTAAVTVLKEYGGEAVGVVIRNVDALRPLPAPPAARLPFMFPSMSPLERCLEPGGPVSGGRKPGGPEARQGIEQGGGS